MQSLIQERSVQLTRLCREHHVRRLEVFGSAARSDFDPASSDLDFLVEFEPISPVVYAQAYFSLKEALEALFKRSVDLITPASLNNPYFRASLAASSVRVYAA
jgi:predicted nucleotidyltransferase